MSMRPPLPQAFVQNQLTLSILLFVGRDNKPELDVLHLKSLWITFLIGYETPQIATVVNHTCLWWPNRPIMHLIQDRLPSLAKSQLYLPIWTTTPWTLPLNQAICFAPEKNYLLTWVKWGEQRLALVWSEELLHELERIVGKDHLTVLCHLKG